MKKVLPIGVDNCKLFRNLRIMDTGDLYTNEMGKYQVINLTLKSAKQRSFESAYVKIREEIAEEFNRHKAILDEYDVPLENAYFKGFYEQMAVITGCLRVSKESILDLQKQK
ncbi:MAG: hypothetical protein ACI4TF_02160 [Oliverpabstia sp.]